MEANSNTPLKVLLAEDNALNQKVMTAFLTHLGHETTLAATGDAALEAIRTGGYDVALVDIQLPEMNGLDIMATVRKEVPNPPYLIAVTAMARSDGDEYYTGIGFDAYLGKPVSMAGLSEALSVISS